MKGIVREREREEDHEERAVFWKVREHGASQGPRGRHGIRCGLVATMPEACRESPQRVWQVTVWRSELQWREDGRCQMQAAVSLPVKRRGRWGGSRMIKGKIFSDGAARAAEPERRKMGCKAGGARSVQRGWAVRTRPGGRPCSWPGGPASEKFCPDGLYRLGEVSDGVTC